MTYLLGMLAGIVSHSDKVGYVAANPVYGVPAAINAFAQGVRAVRPDSRVVLRWACLCDAAHPQDFSDRKDIEVFYSQDFREPEGTYRDYGLCRRLPDGVLQPLGLPEWRWDVFFTEIVRSVFAGTWDSAPGGRAINYWWGLKSGAERVEYPTRLNDGTMQLLKMAERQLCDGEIQVFPDRELQSGPCPSPCGFRHLYAQGTDGDGLAGRVRGGRTAQLRRTGRQDPQPFEHQWSGHRKGNAAVTGKDPRIEKNGAKAS